MLRRATLTAALFAAVTTACAAPDGRRDDAGSAPDVGMSPDPFAGCSRSAPTVTGHAVTPLGAVEGRQAWLWTFEDFGPPGPRSLVIASVAEIAPPLEDEAGASVISRADVNPGELVASPAFAAGRWTYELSHRDAAGTLVSTEATLVFETDDFAAGRRIRGALRASEHGWDVDLAFDFIQCGYLAELCAC